MAKTATAMLTSLLVTAATGLGLGWVSGHPLVGLSLALLLFSVTTAMANIRITNWIESDFDGDPPSTPPRFSALVDAVRHGERKAKAREQSIRQALSRVRVAADAVPDALVALDETGRVLWHNRSAGSMLGLEESDVGAQLSALLPYPTLAAYLERDPCGNSLHLPSPVGASIALSVRAVPYGVGQRLLIAQDITRLQQLERTRRDFVSNVSHELRTPLTVLRGYLESMAQSDDFGNGRWRTPISQMVAQAERMGSIVEDLLHLANLETGGAVNSRASVPIPSVLAAIREDALALSGDANHEITLDCEPDLWLLGVESELRSAFSNLLFNAVRYTPPAGHIDIRWRRSARGAEFCVEDDGDGIAAEHLPRVTERFYRVDVARSRDAGGTGLGLAIVKHVLRQHGASLDISSKLGVGSTFTCRFPADRVVLAHAHRATA